MSPAGAIIEREIDWNALAERVLAGGEVDREEALSILRASDAEIPSLVAAAHRLRCHHFGRSVQLYFLMNAKSGLCPEDCNYCSQSKISSAPVPKYTILDRERLMEGPRWPRNDNPKRIAS